MRFTTLLYPSAAALLLATHTAAQIPLGATYQVTPSTASRGGLNSAAGTLLTRFDRDDLRGFGMTTPGTHVITGVVVEMEDKNGVSPETYSVALYAENPAQIGYPLMATPLATAGPFASPTTAFGPSAFKATVVFPSPVNVPSGTDLFVGIQLAAAPSWPADGLAVDCVLGHSSNWPIYDAPGPFVIQHSSYGLSFDSGFLSYNSKRQLVIDLLTPTPGAAATAVTNQVQYGISNAAPGSGGFLSALHPDVRSVPLNPGRADDIGFVYLDATNPDGTFVLFFADFTGFGPDVSLQGLLPGSRGVACLPIATMQNFGSTVVNNGEAPLFIPIPAPVRAVIAGVPMFMQAVAFDVVLHATPCVRRTF